MPLYPPTTTPLTPTNPVTSSIVSPLPTPTYGTFGTFTVLSKALILRPKSESNSQTSAVPVPASPLTALLNTTTWPLWNTFIPKCTFLPHSPHPGPVLRVGDQIDFDVFMDGNGLVEGKKRSNTSPEEVTIVDVDGFVDAQGRKGGRVGWKTVQFPVWLMRGERVLEVVELENGDGWEFTSFETFGGPLATVVKWTVGATLVDRLGDYGRDLKAFIEKGGEEQVVSET